MLWASIAWVEQVAGYLKRLSCSYGAKMNAQYAFLEKTSCFYQPLFPVRIIQRDNTDLFAAGGCVDELVVPQINANMRNFTLNVEKK